MKAKLTALIYPISFEATRILYAHCGWELPHWEAASPDDRTLHMHLVGCLLEGAGAEVLHVAYGEMQKSLGWTTGEGTQILPGQRIDPELDRPYDQLSNERKALYRLMHETTLAALDAFEMLC